MTEWIGYYLTRPMCWVGYHTRGCRGRVDHYPLSGWWWEGSRTGWKQWW